MDGQLRHMLRDDDVNHDEQKQIIALGLKFRENRFCDNVFCLCVFNQCLSIRIRQNRIRRRSGTADCG